MKIKKFMRIIICFAFISIFVACSVMKLNVKKEYLHSVKKIVHEVLLLFKKAKPKRLEGYVEYGFEDPSNTGKMLAFWATCYPVIEDRIEIIPNFEEKMFDSKVTGYGYVYFVHVLQFFLHVFGDKDIRMTWKDIKKLRSVKEES